MTLRTRTLGRPDRPLAALGLAVALGFATAGAAGATPLIQAIDDGSQPTQIVEVRGGCGFGEHRGPLGGCRLNHGPRGRIRAAETGLPRGCPPRMHRGLYGRCHY